MDYLRNKFTVSSKGKGSAQRYNDNFDLIQWEQPKEPERIYKEHNDDKESDAEAINEINHDTVLWNAQ